MAKKRLVPAQRPDPSQPLAELESPKANYKVLAQIAIGVFIAWAVAFGAKPIVGWWGVGVVAVLTIALAGFGIYVYRMTRKSSNLVDILRGATDAEGRKAALERLRAEAEPGGKDAMNALAQAHLLATEGDVEAAIAVLEQVPIDEAPLVVRDEVRSNLGAMYLVTHRAKEARVLADALEPDRQPNGKAKAMYLAVIAEAKARTGDPDAALTVLASVSAEDPELAEVQPMLQRARVYAAFHAKKKPLTLRHLEALARMDPNLLGPFFTKGCPADLQALAKQTLQQLGVIPRGPKMRMR